MLVSEIDKTIMLLFVVFHIMYAPCRDIDVHSHCDNLNLSFALIRSMS